jgi:hypothetical protein
MSFAVSVKAHFSISAGRLSFLSPPGTQFLGRGQRLLGMRVGNRIAGDNFMDKLHRSALGRANQNLRGAMQRGWQDGVLTRSEANQIRDAGRNRGIARQRVNIDNYRKSYGRAYRNAHADGRITPQERRQLRGMRGNLRRMHGTLNRMVSHDRRMDRMEGLQNRFAGNQVVGFNPQKFLQNLVGQIRNTAGGTPGLGQIGQNMLGRLFGAGNLGGMSWQPPVHQMGQPRGNRYLSWGQQLGGMIRGHGMSRYNRADAAHARGHRAAQANLRNTINNAWKDGVLTLSERNAIGNARRHATMAGQQVKIDGYRRAYGRAMKNAYSDGVLTASERSSLSRMHSNLGSMNRVLDGMRTNDKWADRRDAVQNFFQGNQVVGFDLGKFVNHLMSQFGN